MPQNLRFATGARASARKLVMMLDNETGAMDFTIPEGMSFEEAQIKFRDFIAGLKADGFAPEVEKVEQHRHDGGDGTVRVSAR
jgi:hypothetical protein